MKPEIRDMWADALESDEYEQGQDRLTIVAPDGSERDCCLGVLCKLAVKAGVIKRLRVRPDTGHVIYGDETDENGSTLPYAVMKWAGLDDNNPNVKYDNGRSHSLAEFNDATDPDGYIPHLDFADLAPLIREQL
ncbi:hypothetical protein EAS64_33770 [Trebonia kvetii]|uniref:Uncharacterized protein n=1 Tax=Trebonia kvetii TaxID=2480626 RepID=A0A6P2BQK7_9ACTN|nr:hypothetical protein [Trebonia kvetii]TVZ01250.1 hypothetical protein EAS64_33770 [Trebonia kvetii]